MTLPRITPTRSVATIALAGTCALVASGCGGGVPSNSVAKVGDSNISKSDFDHWLKNASAGQAQQGGAATTPDPPDYTKCVAGLKKAQGSAKGAAKQSDAALKKQCATQYDSLKGQVMQFLIQAQWVTQEAQDQDVKVTDAEVNKAFASQKKQAFPKEADYKKFLKTSGMTEEDILYRLRLDQLQTKLTKKVTEGKTSVSNAEVSSYYAKNKKRFARPATRNLNVVVTKTKAKADEAKAAIDGGQSFAAAAKEFSIDQQSKAQKGKLTVTKGQDKTLDKAVFSAKSGAVTGPTKTQLGYYVFEVTKSTKPSQQTEQQAAGTIRNLLKSQKQQKALNTFIKDFRKKYKDETECGSDFRVAECQNAPKTNTNTAPGGAAPQGATPQGATPQQAPQGATPQQAPQGATPQQAPAPQSGGN